MLCYNSSMDQIPAFVAPILWDVDTLKISFNEHAGFIIERVLEYGGIDALKWAEEQFGRGQLVETLKHSKRLSLKTGRYYSLYFGVNPDELLCIQKPFTQKQLRF